MVLALARLLRQRLLVEWPETAYFGVEEAIFEACQRALELCPCGLYFDHPNYRPGIPPYPFG